MEGALATHKWSAQWNTGTCKWSYKHYGFNIGHVSYAQKAKTYLKDTMRRVFAWVALKLDGHCQSIEVRMAECIVYFL